VGYQPDHQAVIGSAPHREPVPEILARPKRYLLLETVLVLIFAVLVIKGIAVSSAFEVDWLLSPLILALAALVPTAVRHRKFVQLGLRRRQIVASLALLGRTCFVLFPPVFGGLWALESHGYGLPLLPASPQGDQWISWLFYQFMYVAAAEEVFFRGYVQNNILRLLGPAIGTRPRLREWASIGLSAACFAVAHVIIQGQIGSVLTFLPGLVLGWLFIRTRSLLAPVLFHGLANVCYVVIVGLFA
jgi:membrane protease YdiL (CAAX protease family)